MVKFLERCRKYNIKQILSFIYFFTLGHLFRLLFYERKYCCGRHFKGYFGGISAPGWRWVCIDAFGRRNNPNVPWPCLPYIKVGNYKNIHFHPDDINLFQGIGNYFQTMNDGHIYIGKGTYIAMNVGIITANHSLNNLDEHDIAKNVVIGKRCWIGMNSVILPGVVLGENTIVGAGSIVTKSFSQGHCVICGNPARKIKEI